MTVPRKSHSKEIKTMLLIISLIAEENKASANLDNFLSHRPAPQELVDRNIMKGKKKKKAKRKDQTLHKTHCLSFFFALRPQASPVTPTTGRKFGQTKGARLAPPQDRSSTYPGRTD
jgi:hypothetical protein